MYTTHRSCILHYVFLSIFIIPLSFLHQPISGKPAWNISQKLYPGKISSSKREMWVRGEDYAGKVFANVWSIHLPRCIPRLWMGRCTREPTASIPRYSGSRSVLMRLTCSLRPASTCQAGLLGVHVGNNLPRW